jgi:peptidoglycan/xylan/chitin deacetylase (PgdA/CDA1 family)
VIYVEAARHRLSPLEQFGLTVLVDLSGLLRAENPMEKVVSLELNDAPANPIGQPVVLERNNGTVSISRNLLALAGSVAGALAEQESTEEDQHQRVPSSVNAMVAAGATQSPWLDAVARSLREAVVSRSAGHVVRTIAPWPDGHRWAAAFTHDLDVVRGWPLFSGLRLLELVGKGEMVQALRAGGSALVSALRDPIGQGVREILDVEREHAIVSTWFIIAGKPSIAAFRRGDVTYSVEATATRRILSSILQGGHEIGMHGSFATFVSAESMVEEKARLQRVTGTTVTGIRQHFLRMRPGITPRAMVQAGFHYDSTFGYPDRNGFRLGVTSVVPVWDAKNGKALELDEAPLSWMDRALSKYQRIESPSRWVDEGLDLARAAENHEGLWVGLWHPNLTGPLGFPGAPAEFRRMVETVQARRPCIDSLHNLVRWRKARRSLRARRVTDHGVPELAAAEPGNWPVVLEDGRGRALERFSWPAAA